MYTLTNKRIVIISHVYAPGPPHELETYLADKVSELYFIAHPLSFLKNKPSVYRRYRDGQLVEDREGRIWDLPDLVRYLKDFLANLYLIGREPRYDLVIALDNLNAASAIWLRALGKTRKVVFYTIDYIPKRFASAVLNRIYHALDNYCVRKADFVWNLSPVMTEMRTKKGIEPEFEAKQLIVPIGTHILPAETVKKDPNMIVFMGHLRPGQGIDLLLDVMSQLAKELPKAKLRLIGGGPLEGEVKAKVKSLKLNKTVELTGFVPTNEQMRRQLLEGIIAVAPYIDDETTFTRYTDPGKPKEYLAAGLPVIITKVPQFANVIDEREAGIAIEYDATELKGAIVKLLTSPRLATFQKNAVKLAGEYTWDKIFTQAFKAMNDR